MAQAHCQGEVDKYVSKHKITSVANESENNGENPVLKQFKEHETK